jgi:hypothetical protein
MPFEHIIKIANPSPYERSDYVEVDLECAGVPPRLDGESLRLLRKWPSGATEEVAFQIDYPFGRDVGYRVLTLFSRDTPSGDVDYRTHSAEFLLQEEHHADFSDRVDPRLLKVVHYPSPGVEHELWVPDKRYIGVKLINGGYARNPSDLVSDGLQAYFSLVPRPEVASPLNYAGAATSMLHHRAWRGGEAEELCPMAFGARPHSPEKRWGQLTHIDIAPLPWEQRPYQLESLLGQGNEEPEYTLAWSNTGPLRATVTLKSSPIRVCFSGRPFYPWETELTCHLYRVLSMYSRQELYTERLILRPVEQPPLHSDRAPGLGSNRISLPFRAYFTSHIDLAAAVRPRLARIEDIPDYFCVWRDFAEEHRGYAFASEMHIRGLRVTESAINWRLDRGHEHRCIHLFLFHGYPEGPFDPFKETGHAWYEWIYKPLLAIPLSRYVLY